MEGASSRDILRASQLLLKTHPLQTTSLHDVVAVLRGDSPRTSPRGVADAAVTAATPAVISRWRYMSKEFSTRDPLCPLNPVQWNRSRSMQTFYIETFGCQ